MQLMSQVKARHRIEWVFTGRHRCVYFLCFFCLFFVVFFFSDVISDFFKGNLKSAFFLNISFLCCCHCDTSLLNIRQTSMWFNIHTMRRKGSPGCSLVDYLEVSGCTYMVVAVATSCTVSNYTLIAKTLGSTSIKHLSDTFASDRYLIDVDPRVYAIWDTALDPASFQ